MNKRKLWLHLSLILILSLLLTSIPAMAFAEEAEKSEDVSTPDENVDYIQPDDVTKDDAILSESGTDYTVFNLGGEKRHAVFYLQDVRYEDEDGELKDYDPSLVEVNPKVRRSKNLEGYLYQNKDGDSHQYIPENLSEETPIMMEKDDYSITMTPTEKTYKDFFGKKVKVKREKEKVEDAYAKVKEKEVKAIFKDETALASLEYTSLEQGIKENIILNQRPAKNSLQFELHAPGLRAEQLKDEGSIGLYDRKTNKLVHIIHAPNMNDATGKAYSEDAEYTLEKKDGEEDTYILTLTIAKKYLQAKERKYPVVVDPTQTWLGDAELRDVYLSKSSPDTNYYSSARQTMPVGKGSTTTYRTYIKFLSMQAPLRNKLIDSATLKLYETEDSNPNNTVDAFRLTGSFDTGTITWNTQPGTAAKRFAHCVTNGDEGDLATLDMKIYANWVANDNPNYGIRLQGTDESIQRFVKFFGSRTTNTSYRPKLTVNYTVLEGADPGDVTFSSSEYVKQGTDADISWANCNYLDQIASIKYSVWDTAGNTKLSSTITPGDGITSGKIKTEYLSDGTYILKTQMVYANGVASATKSKTFYVDGTAPKIGYFDAEKTQIGPVLGWSVVDANFKNIQLELDGKLIHTSTKLSGEYYPDNLDTSVAHTAKLIVTDKAGNISTATATLKLDSTKPTIGKVQITDSEYTKGGNWYRINQPTIVLSDVKDDSTVITKENISYAIVPEGSVPLDREYIKPMAVTVSGGGTSGYTVTFKPNEVQTVAGKYRIYVRVTDNSGNHTGNTAFVPYYFDQDKPTGRISTRNNLELGDNLVLRDTIMVTGIIDMDNGSDIYDSKLELYKNENGQLSKLETLYEKVTQSKARDLNTRDYANGKYTLKLYITDMAGNTNTISKNVTFANKIAKPKLTAPVSVKDNVEISWILDENITSIQKMQYMVSNGAWIDVPNSASLSGNFVAELPNEEGYYTVTVRAVDSTGTEGQEKTIPVRVDKTAPTAEITSVLQGLIKGSVYDKELLEWKIYLKEKTAADDTYVLVEEGNGAKDNVLLSDLDLYSEDKPENTWYTVKLTAYDLAGNETVVTKDVYKFASYPVPELVEPEFRVKRPEYNDYSLWKFTVPSGQDTLTLTTEWIKSLLLSEADWFVDNQKTAEKTESLPLKNATGSSKYEENKTYEIAAVARGPLNGAHYSMPLYKNAQVQELHYGTRNELTVSFEDAVSFRLLNGNENCTYYIKNDQGQYMKLPQDETMEMLDLGGKQLTRNTLTVKAVPNDGGIAGDVLLSLDILDKEGFSLSGIEEFRPNRLSAKDKVNYKTYLKWGIPEHLPDDIDYEVYRSTEKGFDPELIAPHTVVHTGYYVEPNVDYETTFYYRVRAIRKDENGKIIASSSFSDQAASTVVDADEFTKRLGYKEYWNYADFDLPSGSGYIEKSEGNFMYEQTDANLANELLETAITRTYNSRATSKSAFGVGWNHNYDIELLTTEYSDKLDAGQRMVIKDSTGTLFFFTKDVNASGEYLSSMGSFLKLKKLNGEDKHIVAELPNRSENAENEKLTVHLEAAYVATTKDNLSYYFNEGGKLIYETEPNGNFLLFDYDVNSGLLSKITTGKNLSMEFTYNDRPGTDPLTVKSIKLPDGSTMDYEYSEGMLTKVSSTGAGGVNGMVYRYSYDSHGRINSLTDGAGNVYRIECDKKGAVNTAEYPDGQSINLTYGQDHRQTETVVKKDGAVLYREKAEFDRYSGNCIKVTDNDGLVTTNSYFDELLDSCVQEGEYEEFLDGHLVRRSFEKTTNTTYNEEKNPASEMEADGSHMQTTETTYGTGLNENQAVHERTSYDGGESYESDIEYAYDEYGNLEYEFDDVTDISTEYDYYTEQDGDANLYGEIKSEVEKENGVEQSNTTYQYSYDALGNKTETMTEVAGGITTVTITKYDVMGRMKESSVSVNGTVKSSERYEFDAFGRVVKSVTVEGSKTTTVDTAYNGNSVVDTEMTTVTENGKMTTTTVSYSYDKMNRVISQTTTTDGKRRPETVTFAYTTLPRNPIMGDNEQVYVKVTTNIFGSVSTKTFEDGNGRVLREDAGGLTTIYAYDKSGNRIAQATLGEGQNLSDEGIILSAFGFDKSGNQNVTLVDVTYDAESGTFVANDHTVATSSSFDAQGRLVKSTDGKGIVTLSSYDEKGRMTSVVQDVDGKAIETTVSYVEPTNDENCTSTEITLGNGSKSLTTVNVLGQTILEADLGSGSETAIQKQYTYTDAGNVLKQIDSAGNYRLYDYDESDRLTAVNYFDENGSQTLRTEYTYDILGNVTAMADYRYESGSKVLYRYTEKKYDEFGKVISEAEVDCEGNISTEAELTAKRMVYTYDDDDCLTSVSYPNGFNSRVNGLTFEYGEYNRLKKIHAVTESGSKVLREYTYDSRGKVTEIKDNREALGGTGYALKTYGYDRLERPDAIIVTDSEGESEVEKYTYLYDENNQIVEEGKINNYAKEKLDEKWTYSYDSLGRLLTTTVIDNLSSRTKTEKSYSYDNAGNRLTETENGVTVQSAYNGLNQMVRSGMSTYTYDANGNLIKESGNGLVKEYSYDADNRLDTAVFTENGRETLTQKNTYNGEGQRISKTENNETTRYSYQNGSVVYTKGTDENTAVNLLGNSGNVIASDRINGAVFYNKDMRGSTTSILDGQGTSKVTYQYSDFGETTADSDFCNEICYTGGIYDKGTGLYYLNARYYDPDDGRFLTEDTYRGDAQNPSTLHLYTYCANNPINYVDPSGHVNILIMFGYQIAKATHFSRNIYNTNVPKDEKSARNRKWMKLTKAQSACHQFHAGKYPNAKYLSKDMHKEGVYKGTNNKSGKLVTNAEDQGTYNFGTDMGYKHAALDVAPYMLWGNSAKDRTTIVTRIWVSSKEIRKDIWKKVKANILKISSKRRRR